MVIWLMLMADHEMLFLGLWKELSSFSRLFLTLLFSYFLWGNWLIFLSWFALSFSYFCLVPILKVMHRFPHRCRHDCSKWAGKDVLSWRHFQSMEWPSGATFCTIFIGYSVFLLIFDKAAFLLLEIFLSSSKVQSSYWRCPNLWKKFALEAKKIALNFLKNIILLVNLFLDFSKIPESRVTVFYLKNCRRVAIVFLLFIRTKMQRDSTVNRKIPQQKFHQNVFVTVAIISMQPMQIKYYVRIWALESIQMYCLKLQIICSICDHQ